MSSGGLRHGKQIGRFSLKRRLAIGGMAEVWTADETLSSGELRCVALKVLLPAHAQDVAFRAMFMDEVKIAGELEHENIVRVFDGLEADDHLVLSMELVEGRNLRRIFSALARDGELFPLALALGLAADLARALEYAHTRKRPDGRPLGIVHRDVSPENVMIARDGTLKLLDFGIARAADRTSRTRTGVIKGKVAYMAPEQVVGAEVSARTDIFAMGSLLYEMLTLERLFQGSSDAEILAAVVRAECPSARALRPEIPTEVQRLLAEMLSKNVEARPSSMQAVEAGLEAVIDAYGMRPGASRPAAAAFAARWARSTPRHTGRFEVDVASGAPSPGGESPSARTRPDRPLGISNPEVFDTSVHALEPPATIAALDGLVQDTALGAATPVSQSGDETSRHALALGAATPVSRSGDETSRHALALDAAMPVSRSGDETSRHALALDAATSPRAEASILETRPKVSRRAPALEATREGGVGGGEASVGGDASGPRARAARAHTPRWVYPAIAACLVIIVSLLMLLMMKGK